MKEMLPTIEESPIIEVHCLNSDTNSESGDDSESDYSSQEGDPFISIVNNETHLSTARTDLRSKDLLVSDNKEDSEFYDIVENRMSESRMQKFAVSSKVVPESPLTMQSHALQILTVMLLLLRCPQ